MKCLIIIFILCLPLIMDLWRDQCEYWELCRKQKEEDERIRQIVDEINGKKKRIKSKRG